MSTLPVYPYHQVTCRALPHLEEDDRLLPMVCGLSKRYVGQDYTSKKTNVGQVTADMIDTVSDDSANNRVDSAQQSLVYLCTVVIQKFTFPKLTAI